MYLFLVSQQGPAVAEMMEILGKEETLRRLQLALDLVSRWPSMHWPHGGIFPKDISLNWNAIIIQVKLERSQWDGELRFLLILTPLHNVTSVYCPQQGPAVAEMMEVLGKEETLRRLQLALDLVRRWPSMNGPCGGIFPKDISLNWNAIIIQVKLDTW